jgi:hypothetical protein
MHHRLQSILRYPAGITDDRALEDIQQASQTAAHFEISTGITDDRALEDIHQTSQTAVHLRYPACKDYRAF